MEMLFRFLTKYFILLLGIWLLNVQVSFAQCNFKNPIMEGADPFAFFHEGKYYLLVTRGDRVGIKSAPRLQDIGPLSEINVWRFKDTPVGGHVWAPEMYYIDDNWYIYSCGQNTGLESNPVSVNYVQEDQEMFVLTSVTGDPFGPYEFDSWLMPGIGAIDETIFTHIDGKRYIIWSQFNIPGQPQSQCLYIAELKSPRSIGVKRVMISCPQEPWELHGWPVNEGPAVLQKNGKTYIVYSGSGYLTPEYSLGYLVNSDGDLLNPQSWTKVGPVFQQNPQGGVYATGHNSFTTSPDGTEDWIVYHGRLNPDGNTPRYVFMQKFTWDEDIPIFGKPVPVADQLICPSDTGWIIPVEQQRIQNLSVYPNPVMNSLFFDLPDDTKNFSVTITNLTGQKVLNTILKGEEIDVANLPDGIYFLNVVAEKMFYSGCFIKQNG